MDEELQAAAAAAEAVADAPPGDAVVDADEQAAGLGPAEPLDLDAMIEQARAAAEAETDDAAGDAADPPTTGQDAVTVAAPGSEAAPTPAVDPAPSTDYTKLIADLTERGFKVEPPAPPPDPFAELRNELAPFVGSERYEQLKAIALQELPAEPPSYDAATVEAHEAKVREVNAAKAELRQMDVNRRIHGTSYAWARQQLLNDAGAELAALPEKYAGTDPSRVQNPKSLTDAVDAVAEAVTSRLNAEWQAKYDARERYWAGKVRQAETDQSVARHRAVGSAPAATSVPGGRAAAVGPLSGLFDGKGMLTDAAIERAMRGELATLDLTRE